MSYKSVDGGPATLTNNQYVFSNVTANHIVNVTFKIVQFTITATAGQNGTISCTPNPVNYGGGSICTVSPAVGYAVDAFTVDNSLATLTNNQYVFSNVTASHVVNVTFKPAVKYGDVNNDGAVDLADAILALKAVSGIPATIHKEADVNSDGTIGLAEVIYILQKAAGLR